MEPSEATVVGDAASHAAEPVVPRRSFIKTGAAVGATAAAYLPGLSKPAWAQKGVVKFGCSLPLTGSFEAVSKLYRAGYEMFSEATGRKMRIGDRELDVEWVIYDDEFNPARTAQLTERLITTFSDAKGQILRMIDTSGFRLERIKVTSIK